MQQEHSVRYIHSHTHVAFLSIWQLMLHFCESTFVVARLYAHLSIVHCMRSCSIILCRDLLKLTNYLTLGAWFMIRLLFAKLYGIYERKFNYVAYSVITPVGLLYSVTQLIKKTNWHRSKIQNHSNSFEFIRTSNFWFCDVSPDKHWWEKSH